MFALFLAPSFGAFPHVFAYLDPATSTLIISAIIGAFAAIGMFAKRIWYGTKRMVLPKSESVAESEPSVTSVEPPASRD
ncbi:MAG TPA: hypothetical protein VLA29_13185 [Acidimicrobiia bacterium]|nr:hypothetical protein [Acidimicrobiia bacterium]